MQRPATLESVKAPVVGWLCNYTPVEILYGLGLQPYRVLGDYQRPQRVDAVLHSQTCPYARNCLDVAMRGGYAFLAGAVINGSCMIMNAVHEYWKQFGGMSYVHFLEVPHLESEAAAAFYAENLHAWIDSLCAHFGVTYSAEALRAAIVRQDRIRDLLGELSALRARPRAPLACSELQELVNRGFASPQEPYLVELEAALAQVRARPPASGPTRRRLLVTGAHEFNPEVTGILEELSFQIVYDDLCTGARWYDDKRCRLEGEDDPVMALARTYLTQARCARMADQSGRHQRLLGLARSLEVDAVVCYLNKYCCTFAYDFADLRRELDAASIPHLLLEGDYTSGSSEQVRTRLEAFSELLDMRRPS